MGGGSAPAGMLMGTYADATVTQPRLIGFYAYTEAKGIDMVSGAQSTMTKGARINVAYSGSGLLDEMTGTHTMLEVYNQPDGTSGTITNGRGLWSELWVSGGSNEPLTITNWRGVEIGGAVNGTLGVNTATIGGTDWNQLYIEDLPDFGRDVTNKSGIWIENIGTGRAPTALRSGITLDGNGSGSDIKFGDAQQIALSRNATSGNLDVTGGILDVWNNKIKLGSDNDGSALRSDFTPKNAYILMPHNLTSANDISLLFGSSGGAATLVYIGGGSSSHNAVTGIVFRTASTTTTLNGTTRLQIDGSGNIALGNGSTFGTSAAGVLGIVNGTAPTTSPADKVQLWAEDYVAGDSRLNIMSEVNATDKLTLGAGRIVTTGADPVISSCGTTPSIIGSDMAGKVTIGSGVTTSCTVTFAKAYTTNAPACTIAGDNSAVTYAATTTTDALTITSSADMASDVISYICVGL
jgi:hypothetical protein